MEDRIGDGVHHLAFGGGVMEPWTIDINGVVIGGANNPYGILQVTGIADAPGLVSSNRSRVRRHGMIAGDVFASQRMWTVDISVEDLDWADRLSELRAALGVVGDERPVMIHLPGVAGLAPSDSDGRMMMARPVAFSTPYTTETVVGIVGMGIQFECTDPRLYGEQQEAFLAVPAPTGGLIFPVTPPLMFGVGGSTGEVALLNEGTFDTEWRMAIDGPVLNPTVTNLTTGEKLSFAIQLDVGDTLVLDSDMRSVVLNGVANRYYTVTADSAIDWWALPPGETTLRYDALEVGGLIGNCRVLWRSAWI